MRLTATVAKKTTPTTTTAQLRLNLIQLNPARLLPAKMPYQSRNNPGLKRNRASVASNRNIGSSPRIAAECRGIGACFHNSHIDRGMDGGGSQRTGSSSR